MSAKNKEVVEEPMKMSIEDRNEWFESLSKRERAVAVAQDALLQVAGGAFSLESSYLIVRGANGGIVHPKPTNTLQQILSSGNVHCQVCAIGGAFASLTRLGNQSGDADGFPDASDIIKPTMRAFTRREIGAIEFMFEGWSELQDVFKAGEKEVLYAHYKQHYAPHVQQARFFTIMESIIENKGRFVVPGIHLSNTKPNKD